MKYMIKYVTPIALALLGALTSATVALLCKTTLCSRSLNSESSDEKKNYGHGRWGLRLIDEPKVAR